jgi:hypothetical protein
MHQTEDTRMKKFTFVMAAVAAIFTVTPLFVGGSPAKADNLKMAQGVDVRIDGDRDDHGRRNRRDRDRDVTVGVGPGGIAIGPRERQHCRTVTTTVERDNGRKVQRTERRCD